MPPVASSVLVTVTHCSERIRIAPPEPGPPGQMLPFNGWTTMSLLRALTRPAIWIGPSASSAIAPPPPEEFSP